MEQTRPGWLRIGDFSRLTMISVRMLRHYQEHGLLKPAEVDRFSGYRYYHVDQLERAQLIAQLRDAGFSVESMAKLLGQLTDPTKVDAAIAAQRAELWAARDQLHARLAALDRIGATLKERPEMSEVRVEKLPEMTIAALRRTLPDYASEGLLWQELMPLAVQSGVTYPADGIGGATFHDPEYVEQDVDVEVWLQVAAPFEPTPPLTCRTVPAADVVMSTLRGDYSQMPAITAAIGSYLAEHQLQTGPMFNIYRVGPAQNPDPSSWVTEVCFPIIASK